MHKHARHTSEQEIFLDVELAARVHVDERRQLLELLGGELILLFGEQLGDLLLVERAAGERIDQTRTRSFSNSNNLLSLSAF